MLDPDVDQAHEQNQQEDENFAQRVEPLTGADPIEINYCDRINECDFYFEHHENQRDQIEADVEIDPCAPRRRFAAFIGHYLACVRVVRGEQLLQPEHRSDKCDAENSQSQRHSEVQIHQLITATSNNCTRSCCQEERLFVELLMLKPGFFCSHYIAAEAAGKMALYFLDLASILRNERSAVAPSRWIQARPPEFCDE